MVIDALSAANEIQRRIRVRPKQPFFERHGFLSRVAGNGKLFPFKSRRREDTNAENQGRIT